MSSWVTGSVAELLLEAVLRKRAFIARNYPDGVDEPLCGYSEWDSAMADYNEEIAWLVEGLV